MLKKIFRFKPIDNFIRKILIPNIVNFYLKFVFFTSKLIVIDIKHYNFLEKNNLNHVFACYHGQQIVEVYYHKNKNITVLVSPSRDGDAQAEFLHKNGYNTIRGSSDKSPVKSLVSMIKHAKKTGNNFAFAVDGPKGPLHKVKPGITKFAAKTNYYILPLICNFKNKIILNTWDKSYIPFPFTKIFIIYGKPFKIKNSDNINFMTQKCELKLKKLNELSKILVQG